MNALIADADAVSQRPPSSPKHYFAIINGAAGGGRCGSRAEPALKQLSEHGIRSDVCFTEGPGHASELARRAYQSGVRHFLAAGGDGTVFEVVNGLFPDAASDPPTLGILPLGTGNSFLRDFGPATEHLAQSALTEGEARPIDVIRAKHRDGTMHYINLLGLGFTAEVGALANRLKALSTTGYVAAVLARLAGLRYPLDPIRLDDQIEDHRDNTMLVFSNSRYTGGAMMMAPHADLQDGRLDVIRVNRMSRFELLTAFPKIFRGTHVRHPKIEEHTAARVEFLNPREQDVMVDGEVLRLCLLSLEVLPRALKVMTPC